MELIVMASPTVFSSKKDGIDETISKSATISLGENSIFGDTQQYRHRRA
jgi:hypothetical protein